MFTRNLELPDAIMSPSLAKPQLPIDPTSHYVFEVRGLLELSDAVCNYHVRRWTASSSIPIQLLAQLRSDLRLLVLAWLTRPVHTGLI